MACAMHRDLLGEGGASARIHRHSSPSPAMCDGFRPTASGEGDVRQALQPQRSESGMVICTTDRL
eukprot:143304-Rhodomonas_salina.3